jgi:hypothetical protein
VDAVAEMAAGLIDAELGGSVYKKRVPMPGRGEARSVAPYTITADSLAGTARFVLVLTVTPSRSGATARQDPTTATRF